MQKIIVESNHIPELAVQPRFPKEISISSTLLAQQFRTLHSDNCNSVNPWRTQLTLLRNLGEKTNVTLCCLQDKKQKSCFCGFPCDASFRCKVTWWDVRLCTLAAVFSPFRFWSSLKQMSQLPVTSSYWTATDDLARTNTNLRTKRDLI